MPVKSCSLNIDIHKHEIDHRGTPLFPCGGYTTSIGNCIHDGIPWHWHEEVEVLIVCSGSMILELVGKRFQISEGEGAFINSGILQSATASGGTNCEIQSLVFHSELIAGIIESAIEQRYVRPLLECGKIPGIHFNKGTLWHKTAVQCIFDAFEAYRNESFGYELLVRERLSHLWFLIVSNHQKLLRRQTSIHPDLVRLKNMLEFIHTNYANQIMLSDIAKIASISERECLRCFNRTICVTPMKYLLKYRISVAAGLIARTDKSITEISRESGFESPGYFSSMFKMLMEVSPKEYRRIMTDSQFHK